MRKLKMIMAQQFMPQFHAAYLSAIPLETTLTASYLTSARLWLGARNSIKVPRADDTSLLLSLMILVQLVR